VVKGPAAGGGRWVDVPPERFVAWIAAFARRHGGAGPVTRDAAGATVTFAACDGATAECHPPFPPLRRPPALGAGPATDIAPALGAGPAAGTAPAAETAEAVAAHASAARIVGVLLVRLGGYAVGVFAGSPPRLVRSKTGSRPVHGRSAAGGWSQHRFARRRENQAATAVRAAADAAVAVFGSRGVGGLDVVVLGGDKRSAAGLRGDPRLAPYLERATDRFLTVPDPKLAVLQEIPRAFLAIRIRLTEPEPPASGAQPQ
jgi:Actinobacteria/chloroflexi VLRF1 release factor